MEFKLNPLYAKYFTVNETSVDRYEALVSGAKPGSDSIITVGGPVVTDNLIGDPHKSESIGLSGLLRESNTIRFLAVDDKDTTQETDQWGEIPKNFDKKTGALKTDAAQRGELPLPVLIQFADNARVLSFFAGNATLGDVAKDIVAKVQMPDRTINYYLLTNTGRR